MKKLYTLLFSLLISSLTMFAQKETEPNDNINQGSNAGNTFTASNTTKLSISATISEDNNDFYKINLPSCGSWAFNIINASGQGNVNVKFYNAQNITTGYILYEDFNFDNGLTAPLVINCGQTIWVQIDQTSGTDIGAYKLEISKYTTDDTYECNNDFESASALTNINTSFKAKLWGYDCSGKDDEDWYKVTPTQCGVLNFEITSVAPNQQLVIEVYNQNKVLLSEVDGIRGQSVSLATLLPSGTFYVRVYGKINNIYAPEQNNVLINDPLEIAVTFDTSDAFECNNRFEDASLLTLQPNVKRTITPDIFGVNARISDNSAISGTDFDEDQDWYKVTPTQCGVLNFEITSVAPNQQLVIEVYNQNKVLLSEVDGIRGQSVSLATLLPSGTFYVRVYGKINNIYYPEYNNILMNDPLSIAVTFDTSDAFECNNRFEDASLLTLQPNVKRTITPDIFGVNASISDNSSISGTDFDEDQDWYKVTPTQCGVLNFDITSVAPNQQLVIEVYNQNKVLLSEVDGIRGQSVSLATLLPSGTFYVRVYGKINNISYPEYNNILMNDPLSIAVTFLTSPVVSRVGNTYSTIETSSSQSNTYKWYRNGTLISGADSSTYTSSLAGTYGVCISNTSSCSTCSANLSNESFEKTIFTVFPNPTNSFLKLQFDTNNIIDKVTITDLTGKKVLEQTQNNTQINVQSLAKGTYIIEVSSDDKKFQSKFIKE